MRALLVTMAIALGACVGGLSETCTKDLPCSTGLECVALKSPPTAAEAKSGVAAADVSYCVKGCTKDAECADVSDRARCTAVVAGKQFCAEPQ